MLVSTKISQARHANFQIGFTLIELMVVVSIMGILAALALPNYGTWIENTRIRNAAESIQTGLQKARVEALRHNAQVQFVLGANSAWTLGCVPNAADAADLCPDLIESRAASEGSSANITVTATPAGSTTIIFTNLGTVLANPPAPTVPFTQLAIDSSILPAANSRDLRITMGAGGIGRVCDPYAGLPVTDPRRC